MEIIFREGYDSSTGVIPALGAMIRANFYIVIKNGIHMAQMGKQKGAKCASEWKMICLSRYDGSLPPLKENADV
jgi:hypothetical protein